MPYARGIACPSKRDTGDFRFRWSAWPSRVESSGRLPRWRMSIQAKSCARRLLGQELFVLNIKAGNISLLATMVIPMVTVALLSYGCATSSPKVVSTLTVPSLPPPKTVGSLWQEENGRAYLYEDLRAMCVGDILTIKIVENHKGSKSADTSAERDSTIHNSLSGVGIGYIG